MSGESVLVTGSSGSIGTALTSELLERGYDVTGADVRENPWLARVNDRTLITDLSDTNEVEQLPRDVDTVVHLAAHARVHDIVKDPRRAKENVETLFNVLEFARDAGIPNFIFASSREVYGNESDFINDEPEITVSGCESPYAASKVGGEALVQSYDECYDMNCGILRFSNVYGKYDDSDRVVPLFLEQASEGETMTVYGEGKLLDFTYIEDCVDGIVNCISSMNRISGEVLNIASGNGSSLIELAETVNEHVEPGSPVEVESNRTGEVQKFVADISKAEKTVGYDPEYTLAEGIEETVRWYDENGLI